jgi:hypothetical protein
VILQVWPAMIFVAFLMLRRPAEPEEPELVGVRAAKPAGPKAKQAKGIGAQMIFPTLGVVLLLAQAPPNVASEVRQLAAIATGLRTEYSAGHPAAADRDRQDSRPQVAIRSARARCFSLRHKRSRRCP